MNRRPVALAAVVVAFVLPLGACGLSDDNQDSSKAPVTTQAPDALVSGVDLQSRGDLDGALKSYDQVIASGSDEAKIKAHFNQGVIYGSQGKHDQAIAAYSKVLELSPNALDAAYNKAVSMRAKGDKAGAMAQFTAGLTMPDAEKFALKIHLNIGELKDEMGDRAGAKVAFDEARKLDPNAPVRAGY